MKNKNIQHEKVLKRKFSQDIDSNQIPLFKKV